MTEPRALGVYVHFPWCLQKCPYCDFLSVPAERREIPQAAYTNAVLSELEVRAAALGDYRLNSVFFGGGTPSLWEPAELGRVLAAVLRAPGARAEDVEITVECNPSSLDYERARALREQGVNRLSIGVQSLDERRLAFLGRLHDGPGALRAVSDAVRAGFTRVSADLIFGVAGQTPAEAEHEASVLAELGITHLSAYALTIEPGTRFGELSRAGKLPLLEDALVAGSFEAVEATLARFGFEHYEISNYAKPGARALHNLGYWRGDDYLGLGTGAWGTWRTPDGRVRYRNTPSPERYMSGWQTRSTLDFSSKNELTSELEPIQGDVAVREQLMLGLRLAEGVDLEQIRTRTGAAVRTPEREKSIARLVARGLLELDGELLRIPPRRWLLADGIIADVI